MQFLKYSRSCFRLGLIPGPKGACNDGVNSLYCNNFKPMALTIKLKEFE